MKKISEENIFIIIICAILTVAILIVGTANKKVKDIYAEAKSIVTEWKENNATVFVSMQDGTGVLTVNNNEEAYMEMISNTSGSGSIVFLKNGNAISLIDGLPTEKCKHPIDVIDCVIDNSDAVSKIDASSITGNKADKNKKGIILKVNGLNNVIEVLEQCTDGATSKLAAYGATENSEVSLLLSGYKGINTYDNEDNKVASIKNEGLVGFGTLQLDLIIDDKAYMIYSIRTIATSDKVLRVGDEIYKCSVGKEFSTEESYSIAETTIEVIKSSIGIEDTAEEKE